MRFQSRQFLKQDIQKTVAGQKHKDWLVLKTTKLFVLRTASVYGKAIERRQMRQGQMTARELEAAILARCMSAAREVTSTAQNQREANIFQLAAMVLRSQFPLQSANLERASEQYFVSYPDERLTPVEVVRNGWVVSLPRLRDRLCRKLP